MEAVIKYAFSLATKYGEGTSAVAAEMYDAVAKSQGAKVPAAELASTASYEDTAKAVTHAKGVSDRNIPGAVETLVKQAGEDTTIKNAIRGYTIRHFRPTMELIGARDRNRTGIPEFTVQYLHH